MVGSCIVSVEKRRTS